MEREKESRIDPVEDYDTDKAADSESYLAEREHRGCLGLRDSESRLLREEIDNERCNGDLCSAG